MKNDLINEIVLLEEQKCEVFTFSSRLHGKWRL